MLNGQGQPIARSKYTRAGKELPRVFFNLSGQMEVWSIRGKWYTLIVQDECTRFHMSVFLRQKSGAASAFSSFLAEVRVDGTPSAVMVVWSDYGGEFFEHLGELCRKRGIKPDLAPADSPKYNGGVAERRLAWTNVAALVARIQSVDFYAGAPNHSESRGRGHIS